MLFEILAWDIQCLFHNVNKVTPQIAANPYEMPIVTISLFRGPAIEAELMPVTVTQIFFSCLSTLVGKLCPAFIMVSFPRPPDNTKTEKGD